MGCGVSTENMNQQRACQKKYSFFSSCDVDFLPEDATGHFKAKVNTKDSAARAKFAKQRYDELYASDSAVQFIDEQHPTTTSKVPSTVITRGKKRQMKVVFVESPDHRSEDLSDSGRLSFETLAESFRQKEMMQDSGSPTLCGDHHHVTSFDATPSPQKAFAASSPQITIEDLPSPDEFSSDEDEDATDLSTIPEFLAAPKSPATHAASGKRLSLEQFSMEDLHQELLLQKQATERVRFVAKKRMEVLRSRSPSHSDDDDGLSVISLDDSNTVSPVASDWNRLKILKDGANAPLSHREQIAKRRVTQFHYEW